MAGLNKHLYPDSLQLFLLAVCLFDLVFFSFYLFTYELAKQNTISDSLFQHPEYVIVLSITLAIRSLGVCLYLMRFRNENSGWVITGFVGLFVTLSGWYVTPLSIIKPAVHPSLPSSPTRSTVTYLGTLCTGISTVRYFWGTGGGGRGGGEERECLLEQWLSRTSRKKKL